MVEEAKIVLIFLIGLVSSFFWGFISWGISVISIGLMSLLWLPPQLSGITFKLWKVGNSIAWVTNFHKEWLIRKELIIGLGIAMMVGGCLGSFFIMSIPDFIMYGVSAVSMIVLVIVAYYKKSGTGPRHTLLSPTRKIIGYFGYFILALFGNLFPAGSGVWYYFANTFLLKLTTLEWKATWNTVAIFWFVGTTIGILLQWVYNLYYGLALGVGMYIGWYFATKHMIKIGDQKSRDILLVWICIFAFYFLYLAYNSWQ